MSDIPKRSPTSFGLFPVLSLAYGAYFMSDVWGKRFETLGYGAFCTALLVILSMALIVRTVRTGSVAMRFAGWFRDAPSVVSKHSSAIGLALSLVVYAFLQHSAGYLLATAIAFLWLQFYLKGGSMLRIALVAACLTAVAWLALIHVLQVPLPESPFGGFA
ncbi:MAG: tripartite tricarboxylate transporter TctB family protein [Rhodospirillales bacterium]